MTTCAHLILLTNWSSTFLSKLLIPSLSPVPISRRSIAAFAVWPFLCVTWFYIRGCRFNIHRPHYYQVTLTPLCNKYLTWSFAELVQSMRTELRLVLLKTLRACTSRLINVLIWNNYIFFNSLDMSILKPILFMKSVLVTK